MKWFLFSISQWIYLWDFIGANGLYYRLIHSRFREAHHDCN
jgi:hypothetical protein